MKDKKWIVGLVMGIFLFSAGMVQAGMGEINTKLLISAETISASANTSSEAIDLTRRAANGIFSIQVLIEGDGTAKFEYLLSIDGVNFLEPSSASDIATGLVDDGGPGGDGRNIYSFSPEPARWLKIKVTETGTSNTITATVWLLTQ